MDNQIYDIGLVFYEDFSMPGGRAYSSLELGLLCLNHMSPFKALLSILLMCDNQLNNSLGHCLVPHLQSLGTWHDAIVERK